MFVEGRLGIGRFAREGLKVEETKSETKWISEGCKSWKADKLQEQ